MKLKPAILMITAILTACSTNNEISNIHWNADQVLPLQKDGQKNIGIAGPVSGIIGDRLIVAGGANFPDKKPWEGGTKQYSTDLYVYQIVDNKLTLLHQQTLTEGIAYVGSCSTNSALYIAGGENKNGISDQVKRLTFVKDSIVQEAINPLPHPLTNGSLVAAGEKLYYIGGENQNFVSDKVYSLDLSDPNNDWEASSTLPYAVTNAVVVSNTRDKIYIAGGRKRNQGGISTIYNSLLELDLSKKSCIEIDTLPAPLAAGTGVLEASGDLLIFGGDNAQTFHKVEHIIAELAETDDPIQKEILNVRKAELQNDHPGFTSETWSYNIAKRKWTSLSAITGNSPVTTTAFLHGDLIIIPSGEIKPGVRTDQILIGSIERK